MKMPKQALAILFGIFAVKISHVIQKNMDVILSSINVDFDCLASMVAAKKLYPRAKMCLMGSTDKGVREFIKEYAYKFNFTKERHIRFDTLKRLIIVDNQAADRLGNFQAIAESGRVAIHIYDHHPHIEDGLDAEVIVLRDVGSTITLLVELLIERGIQITPFEATLFALGVYEDTGNFLHVNTTSDDFKVCAYLLSCGADLKIIHKYLTQHLTLEQVQLLNTLLLNIELHDINGIKVPVATAKIDEYISEIAILAPRICDMKSFDALILLVQMNDKVCAIARSTLESVDVGSVMQAMGGGGHHTAASVTLHHTDLETQYQRLIQALHQHVKPVGLAWQIMSTPVDTVPESWTIARVKQRMLSMHHKYMCVVNTDGELIGIVTRNDLSKAMSQGLGEHYIRTCMTSKVITKPQDTPYYVLQKTMNDEKIGSIPILNNQGKLAGIVTREDLLRIASQITAQHQPSSLPPDFDFDNARILLENRLPKDLYRFLHEMGQAGNVTGMPVYLVGGFVRDLLLKRKNYDIDLVVEGDAMQFAHYFCERYEGSRTNFTQFNTVILSLPNSYIPGGLKVDIATARIEHYDHPAALPVVESSVIKHDLYRRDFTINAIAIQINPQKFGHVFDLFGGRRDLHLGIIRVLHNGSFFDDPTRILRAIRFEQRFGFELDENSQELLKTATKAKILKRVSEQRIRDELINILREEHPHLAIRRMDEFQILVQLNPHIVFNANLVRRFEAIEKTLVWFKMQYPADLIEDWSVFLLGLVADLTPSQGLRFGKKLLWHRHIRDKINELLRHQNDIIKKLDSSSPRANSLIFKTLVNHSKEILLYLFSIGSDEVKHDISKFLSQLRYERIQIKGNELLKMGLAPGPAIGDVLREILYHKLDGLITDYPSELELAKNLISKCESKD